jgi:hypothetical protein
MDIDLIRYNDNDSFTDGLFLINGEFKAHTLEDEYRTKKVFGETRISAGRFKVELRTVGGFHQRYLKKFGPTFHTGMLWIKDVPNFKYVLIHIGNDEDDTAGCVLVGMKQDANDAGFIGGSIKAYKKIYPIIRDAILSGEEVYINIYDNIYSV